MPNKYFEGSASIIRRFIAFIIDLLLLNFVIIAPFGRVITKSVPKDFTKIREYMIAQPEISSKLFYMLVVIAIIMLLYFALCEYKLGQTLGKIIMKLHVKSDTKTLLFWQCVVRSLFMIPIFPLFLLIFIDPLVMIFTKNNKRLSEILSKTKTIQHY